MLLLAARVVEGAEVLREELEREARPQILAFGSIHGGTAANVIPESVELVGSLRSPSPELLQHTLGRFEKLVRSLTEPAGARFELALQEGYPPVYNDPRLTALFREAAAAVVGDDHITALDRVLATGDDVCLLPPGGARRLLAAGLPRHCSRPCSPAAQLAVRFRRGAPGARRRNPGAGSLGSDGTRCATLRPVEKRVQRIDRGLQPSANLLNMWNH